MVARRSQLDHDHTPEAIRARIAANTQHGALGDFVLGAVDGTVTTFAIVAGVAGAGLSAGIALVLGLANVLADGASMAVGNYLKARSDHLVLARYRRVEEGHIDRAPEGEREEIRQIFANKGFEGDMLEHVIEVITADRERWVDTMLREEWGLSTSPPSPMRAGGVTFVGFVAAGIVPLLPLVFSELVSPPRTFVVSAIAATVTFLAIGLFRSRVTHEPLWKGATETLLVGGLAASLAFFVGVLFRGYAGIG